MTTTPTPTPTVAPELDNKDAVQPAVAASTTPAPPTIAALVGQLETVRDQFITIMSQLEGIAIAHGDFGEYAAAITGVNSQLKILESAATGMRRTINSVATEKLDVERKKLADDQLAVKKRADSLAAMAKVLGNEPKPKLATPKRAWGAESDEDSSPRLKLVPAKTILQRPSPTSAPPPAPMPAPIALPKSAGPGMLITVKSSTVLGFDIMISIEGKQPFGLGGLQYVESSDNRTVPNKDKHMCDDLLRHQPCQRGPECTDLGHFGRWEAVSKALFVTMTNDFLADKPSGRSACSRIRWAVTALMLADEFAINFDNKSIDRRYSPEMVESLSEKEKLDVANDISQIASKRRPFKRTLLMAVIAAAIRRATIAFMEKPAGSSRRGPRRQGRDK
jgi:hypothetical protein